MKIKVIVHEAEEGGYWAEVPALPGCATQAESFEELLQNLGHYHAKSRGEGARSGNCRMRAMSGRDFGRLVESHG
jgi:hypothetical protein